MVYVNIWNILSSTLIQSRSLHPNIQQPQISDSCKLCIIFILLPISLCWNTTFMLFAKNTQKNWCFKTLFWFDIVIKCHLNSLQINREKIFLPFFSSWALARRQNKVYTRKIEGWNERMMKKVFVTSVTYVYCVCCVYTIVWPMLTISFRYFFLYPAILPILSPPHHTK